MRGVRILGDDPAPKNYGRCVLIVDCVSSSLKFKIKYLGMVTKTIKNEDLKGDIAKTVSTYIGSVETMIAKHGPIHFYCAERFMPRSGTIQGGEVVSMMVGFNVATLGGTESKLIPAVTWKSQIKRYFDLKKLYASVKPGPDHLLDATLIGLYMAYTHFKIKPYSTLTKDDVLYIIKKVKRAGMRLKLKENLDKKQHPEKYVKAKKLKKIKKTKKK